MPYAAQCPRYPHPQSTPQLEVRARLGPRGEVDPASLVARCAADPESEAWDELVERFGPCVENGARRALARFGRRPDPATVEDYAQETWFRLLEDGCRRLRGFRGDSAAALRAWLGRIAERTAIDLLRSELAAKRGGDVRVPGELSQAEHRAAVDECPLDRVELRDRLRCLGRRVLALNGDPRNARLLRLVLVEGWTAAELSRASGGRIRPGRVDSLVHRIRRRLAAEGWDVRTAGRIAA